MKRLFPSFVFLFALISSLSVNAQLYNLSLTDSMQPIIYHGVANHFRINNTKSNDVIHVRTGYGRINAYDFNAGEFSYYCQGNDVKSDTLKIYKNDTLLFARRYDIKFMPVPQVKLGALQLTSDTVSVEEIFKNNTMTVEMPGCIFKHKQYIMSFILEITDVNGIPTSDFPRTMGNALTKEQQEELKKLVSGQQVIIRKPRSNCKECAMPGTLPPLTLIIK